MIVLDTSALIAILRRVPEADSFLRIIVESDLCLLSSVTFLETSMVLAGNRGSETSWAPLDDFLDKAGVEIVLQDRASAEHARSAIVRYGRARHPAALNFGDCASYALAKARNLALLFKGNDFSATDQAGAQ